MQKNGGRVTSFLYFTFLNFALHDQIIRVTNNSKRNKEHKQNDLPIKIVSQFQ